VAKATCDGSFLLRVRASIKVELIYFLSKVELTQQHAMASCLVLDSLVHYVTLLLFYVYANNRCRRHYVYRCPSRYL